MDFYEERMIDLKPELEVLIQANHDESGLYKDMELTPMWEAYYAMDDMGMFQAFTMREEGKLVGYSLFMSSPHMHYSATEWALNDVVYVDPEYRGANTVDFFNFVEDELTVRGVDVITYHMKALKPFEKLMGALGFKHAENTYTKRIV